MHPAEECFDALAPISDADSEDQEVGAFDCSVDLARASDGPVLEVGRGTGRVSVELLRGVVEAYGFDVSGASSTNSSRRRRRPTWTRRLVWIAQR